LNGSISGYSERRVDGMKAPEGVQDQRPRLARKNFPATFSRR
jgi:hypothetical protein